MKLVYLSPVKWESIAQRPHFFVKSALNVGFESILWVEPTPSRLPKIRDIKTKLVSVEANSFDKPENVDILSLRMLPLEPLGTINKFFNSCEILRCIKTLERFLSEDTILVIGKPSQLAQTIIERLDFSTVIFDVMDDFPEFYSGVSSRKMEKIHHSIICRSELCLFSSHNLKTKYGSFTQSNMLILNACDVDFVRKVENIPKAKSERRVFGYVGSIAAWFDWESLIELALKYPEDKFVLVGPNYSDSSPNLPTNIELRCAVDHSEVPRLLRTFDYGLIPFVSNSLTHAVDPVKYYEYCAAGLEVISTSFGEMKDRVQSDEVHSFKNFPNDLVCNQQPVLWSDRFNELWVRLGICKEIL
ncbi:glycosyl transferase [Vibrio nigripulchritudo]|uniref:glycosyl transferase n=1 Tax=Vibrio nigripulchritudo TaxID=28173 RepID=UPI0003B1FB11|nr:glycosyl transferase [Vibrio nigripulchritudo]CCN70288.1 putative glycosyltransferase [Vibrio nigripulchritudo SFn118]